ncbi:MAG: hypothetical protein JOZ25_06245, partial [Actinobacteria bacterium]|nr:hypothetical protein [Actinomycetota bacterium]
MSVLGLIQSSPSRPTDPVEIARQVHEAVSRGFEAIPRAWGNRNADGLEGYVSSDYLA